MSLIGIGFGLLGVGGVAAVAGAIFAPALTLPILRAGAAFATRAAGFVAEHWQATLVVIAIGAAVLFGLQERGEARHQAKLAANYEGLWHAEQKAHGVTKKSLVDALAQIEDNNDRIKAAAKRYQDDSAQWAKKDAALGKEARSTDERIAGLLAASRRPRAPCTISDEARKALEGL